MSASAANTGAAAMRFLHCQGDDAGFVFRDDDDDDTDDNDINLLFQQQQPITEAHEEIVVVHNEVAVITAAANPKLTRIKYPCRIQKHSQNPGKSSFSTKQMEDWRKDFDVTFMSHLKSSLI
jgi:hypothetical protein